MVPMSASDDRGFLRRGQEVRHEQSKASSQEVSFVPDVVWESLKVLKRRGAVISPVFYTEFH